MDSDADRLQLLRTQHQCHLAMQILGTVNTHASMIANLPDKWSDMPYQALAPVRVNATRFGCCLTFTIVSYVPGQVARSDSSSNGIMATNLMTQEDRKKLLYTLPVDRLSYAATHMLSHPPRAEKTYDPSKPSFVAGFCTPIRVSIVVATHEDAALEFAAKKTTERWRFSDVSRPTVDFVKQYATPRKASKGRTANADEVKLTNPTHVAIVCPHKMDKPPDCPYMWWHIDAHNNLICA